MFFLVDYQRFTMLITVITDNGVIFIYILDMITNYPLLTQRLTMENHLV